MSAEVKHTPDRIAKCSVRAGNFVEPCTALEEVTIGEAAFNSRKGVVVWNLFNLTSGAPTRSFIGVRSGSVHKKGMAFNFCPFCGTDISAPFLRETAA